MISASVVDHLAAQSPYRSSCTPGCGGMKKVKYNVTVPLGPTRPCPVASNIHSASYRGQTQPLPFRETTSLTTAVWASSRSASRTWPHLSTPFSSIMSSTTTPRQAMTCKRRSASLLPFRSEREAFAWVATTFPLPLNRRLAEKWVLAEVTPASVINQRIRRLA